MQHGWVSRGDTADATVRRDVQLAIEVPIFSFSTRHLLDRFGCHFSCSPGTKLRRKCRDLGGERIPGKVVAAAAERGQAVTNETAGYEYRKTVMPAIPGYLQYVYDDY
jgi:hypothetical protein